MALLFQIGFNKTATSALYKLFHKSGAKCIQHTGVAPAHVFDREPAPFNVQKKINFNILGGRPPLNELEKYDSFFDMQSAHKGGLIENFKYYRELFFAYPQAYFLLNTRDETQWLRSRVLHRHGQTLLRESRLKNKSGFEVLLDWREDYRRHNDEVRAFFEVRNAKFLEFNVSNDPIRKLIKFCKKDFALQAKYWSFQNVTVGGVEQEALAFEAIFGAKKQQEVVNDSSEKIEQAVASSENVIEIDSVKPIDAADASSG